jgi:hypothetical protein
MATTPSAPNVYLLPKAGISTIEYLWYAPTVNGDAVTNYELTLEPGPLVYTLSSINRYKVTGLSDGETYSASIRATCNYPDWGPSAAFFEFQPGFPPPMPPISAIITAVGSTSAMVSWEPPSVTPTAKIFWYVLESKSDNSNDPVLRYTAGGQTQSNYFITGLNRESTYYFSVNAVNCPGYSPQVSTNTIQLQPIYSPLLVDGIQLWLDAQDATTFTFIQSSITQWNDKSGNSRNATPYQALYPTSSILNSYPAVGIYSNAAIRSPMTSGVTSSRIFSFIVFQKTGPAFTGAAETIIARTSNNQPAPIDVYNNTRYRGNGTTNNLLTSPMSISSVTTPTLYDFTATANLWQEWRNASSIMSNITTSAFGDATSFIYFGDRADNGNTFTGSIGEIIVYNSNFTPFDRQKTEGYLAWKWGIQSNLPVTHPFYTAAPYYSTIFSPTTFSSIRLWYDGADPLGTGVQPPTGSSIQTWFDKSGYGNNATAGTTNPKFISSLGGYVLFNGASDYYNIANSSWINNQYFTVFVVDYLSSSTAVPAILNGDGNPGSTILMRYTPVNPTLTMDYNYRGVGGGAFALSPSPSSNFTGPARMWSMQRTSTGGKFFLNGTSLNTDAVTTPLPSWSGAQLGQRGGTNWYNGGMKEILFYVGNVSDDDRQTVEGYLAWKWNLEGMLPTAHPYRTITPVQLIQPFQPNLIPNLSMWMDAADRDTFWIFGASNVYFWLNKAGGTNQFGQNTNANRPVLVPYGSSYAVQFNGSATSLVGTAMSVYFPNNARTIFIVGVADSIGTNNATPGSNVALIGAQNSAIRFGMYFRSSGLFGVYNYDTNSDTATVAYTAGQVEIFQYEFGGGTLGARLTGGTAATVTSGNTGTMTTAVTLGLQSTSFFLNGKIMEVLIYSRALGTTERQQVEGYLAWKWDLVSKLPSDHPYKNSPVPGFRA